MSNECACMKCDFEALFYLRIHYFATLILCESKFWLGLETNVPTQVQHGILCLMEGFLIMQVF
jgi:hypothetical protein